jgi:hypothetical protein
VAALFTDGRQLRGVERAHITFEIAADRAHWGAEIAGKVKAWARALTGPTSLPGRYPQLMNAPGCETGPGVAGPAITEIDSAHLRGERPLTHRWFPRPCPMGTQWEWTWDFPGKMGIGLGST